MANCKICCLYSGSKGNSTYIEINNKKILIDAGKSARSLCLALKEIGVSPSDLDAIFITHEHTDHVSALQTLSHKYQIPIHIMLNSAKKFEGLCDEALCSCLYIHEKTDFSVNIGEVKVRAFPTPHDSRASVGYRIECGDEKIAYATDVGHVTDVVKNNLYGCSSVVLESNHDSEMLLFGPYPYELKERISSKYGHLSNRECAELSAFLCENGTKNILLAHLSEENNTPEIAYNETLSSIGGYEVNLRVASQTEPVWLVGDDVERSIPTSDEFYKLWCRKEV